MFAPGLQQHLLHHGQPEPDPLPVPVFTQVLPRHLQLCSAQQRQAGQHDRLRIQAGHHHQRLVWGKLLSCFNSLGSYECHRLTHRLWSYGIQFLFI